MKDPSSSIVSMSVDRISIIVVNSKSVNERDKSLLQNALSLYNEELPSMGYAANTGKESRFLERCVTNGKYCTLLLKQQTTVGKSSVIAAITYQIIPADTQYAEIPLAAVQRGHQRKGLGTALYQELHMRLQDVGVLTTFCWGDQESEKFWAKQGFAKIAEVDGRGRPQKLRLKADVRKAMCMPGSSTLMVCQIGDTATEKNLVPGATKLLSYRQSLQAGLLQLPHSVESIRASPSFSITTPVPEAPKPAFLVTSSESSYDRRANPAAGKVSMNNLTPLNIAGALARVASKPFCDDVENLTPRRTPKETRCASPQSTVKRSPSMFRDNVLQEVSNVTPKPGSQRFAALCDVASSLTNQAEDQPQKNSERSATREEQHKCTFQLPEQGCIVAQEKQKASCERHFDILPEEPALKHTRGVVRTYKKRSGAPNAVPAQSPGILTTKGSEPESLRLDQGIIAENAHSTGAVLERSPEARTKKHRSAGGGQPSADQTMKNNDGPVIARVLRTTDKRKSGLTVSALKAGQRSDGLSVPLEKDADIQDVPMTEASDCPFHMQKPDLSCLREREASAACNDNRREQLEMTSIGEGLDEGHRVCSGDKGVAIVNDTTVQGIGADRDQNVGLANPAATDESAGQNVLVSKEVISAMDVHEYTAGASMSVSIDEGGDTELIASKHCCETTGLRKVEYAVMFMNMANEARRKQLTQFVEQLGGEVTGTGIDCTIVVTGEVRTTLNFCTALCAGAWVVSSNWLRDSVRNKKFVDPAFYILHDKAFEMKYEASVQEVVLRARQKPKSLFKGFHLYPTPNVNPNLETIVQLITSAGGKVLSNLQEALATEDPCRTIILACDDDTMEALEVSPRGMWVFSVDWFMSCIIRQDIDLGKPQFAEPLC